MSDVDNSNLDEDDKYLNSSTDVLKNKNQKSSKSVKKKGKKGKFLNLDSSRTDKININPLSDEAEPNITDTKKDNMEIPDMKTRDEYLVQIEQLQNELALEQKISNKIQDPEGEEGKIKYQNILKERTEKLNQLDETNKKQEKAYHELKEKIVNEVDKIEKRKRISITETSPVVKTRKNKKMMDEESKKEAIDIVLKIKEKEINLALTKMKEIKKENNILKKELYKNKDYSDNIELEDNSNEKKKKIELLTDELNILNNQLEVHKKCIADKSSIDKEDEQLKNELKNIRKKIKEVQYAMKEKYNDKKLIEKLADRNPLSKNNKNKNLTTNENLSLSQTIKRLILPNIFSTKKAEKNILDDEFYKKLKNVYKGKDKEYDALVEKIKISENKGKEIETKHKSEIKIFDSQITNLDNQFNILNNEGKENFSNIKILKSKLNINRSEVRQLIKGIQKVKKKLEFINNLIKEKDYTIFNLLKNIETIRQSKKIKVDELTEKHISQKDLITKYESNNNNNTNNNINNNKNNNNIINNTNNIANKTNNNTNNNSNLTNITNNITNTNRTSITNNITNRTNITNNNNSNDISNSKSNTNNNDVQKNNNNNTSRTSKLLNLQTKRKKI